MCPSWKMMEFVNVKDDIPYIPNHQPVIISSAAIVIGVINPPTELDI